MNGALIGPMGARSLFQGAVFQKSYLAGTLSGLTGVSRQTGEEPISRERKDPIMAHSLGRRSFEAIAQFLIFLAALIFLPAWSLRYWQGWLFFAVFSASIILMTVYFLKADPGLVERRLKAGPVDEKLKSQKRIQTFASILIVLLILVPALDHRFGWSSVPAIVSIAGDVLVVAGFAVTFFVFRANSYTSGTVEVAKDQTIVTTGPYGIVRHPMYSGALLMFLGMPLALGSWYGLLLVIPMAAVLVWRLQDEERYLERELPGYPEYRQKVHYRLVPGIY
jgi:protein-S-isoprenylcysteine O-methyltransferase Ste14